MCYLLTPNTCARVHVCVCVPRSRHVFRAGEAGFIDYFGILDGHKPEPPHHKQPKVRSSGMLQEEADYLTARARAMREWKPTRSRRIRDRWFGGEAPPVEQETGFLEDWRARATARPTFQVVHNKAEAGVWACGGVRTDGVCGSSLVLTVGCVPRADKQFRARPQSILAERPSSKELHRRRTAMPNYKAPETVDAVTATLRAVASASASLTGGDTSLGLAPASSSLVVPAQHLMRGSATGTPLPPSPGLGQGSMYSTTSGGRAESGSPVAFASSLAGTATQVGGAMSTQSLARTHTATPSSMMQRSTGAFPNPDASFPDVKGRPSSKHLPGLLRAPAPPPSHMALTKRRVAVLPPGVSREALDSGPSVSANLSATAAVPAQHASTSTTPRAATAPAPSSSPVPRTTASGPVHAPSPRLSARGGGVPSPLVPRLQLSQARSNHGPPTGTSHATGATARSNATRATDGGEATQPPPAGASESPAPEVAAGDSASAVGTPRTAGRDGAPAENGDDDDAGGDGDGEGSGGEESKRGTKKRAWRRGRTRRMQLRQRRRRRRQRYARYAAQGRRVGYDSSSGGYTSTSTEEEGWTTEEEAEREKKPNYSALTHEELIRLINDRNATSRHRPPSGSSDGVSSDEEELDLEADHPMNRRQRLEDRIARAITVHERLQAQIMMDTLAGAAKWRTAVTYVVGREAWCQRWCRARSRRYSSLTSTTTDCVQVQAEAGGVQKHDAGPDEDTASGLPSCGVHIGVAAGGSGRVWQRAGAHHQAPQTR